MKNDLIINYCKETVLPSMVKHKLVLLGVIGFVIVFNTFFTVGINATESLPDHVYLVVKNQKNIQRGDYVAFRWNGGGPYPAGLTFIKLVKGVGGDHIEAKNRTFFVNGSYVGVAKEKSRTGEPLQVGSTGVIPANYFYAYAPHKDSLDSRYAMMGLVSYDRIQGRAIPLF